MSYHDDYIAKIDATVDDEYQRMLLHQSMTVSFNALMWLTFIAGAVVLWLFPSEKTILIWTIMMTLPGLSIVVGYGWLRKKTPMPRVNRLTTGEKVGIVAIGIASAGGVVNARAGGDWGNATGLLEQGIGIIVGLVFGFAVALIILKSWVPRMRRRDEKRFDAEYDD